MQQTPPLAAVFSRIWSQVAGQVSGARTFCELLAPYVPAQNILPQANAIQAFIDVMTGTAN